jgi:hypothetical protein
LWDLVRCINNSPVVDTLQPDIVCRLEFESILAKSMIDVIVIVVMVVFVLMRLFRAYGSIPKAPVTEG